MLNKKAFEHDIFNLSIDLQELFVANGIPRDYFNLLKNRMNIEKIIKEINNDQDNKQYFDKMGIKL